MNVPTMDMDQEQAAGMLDDYLSELRRAADSEYSAIAAGLEAMSQGRTVLSLTEVIAAGGRDERGLPNLAVARADRKEVALRSTYRLAGWDDAPRAEGRLYFTSFEPGYVPPADYDGLLAVRVDLRDPEWTEAFWTAWHRRRFFTDVPLVPPQARRACGGKTKLRDHLVLWEVEGWRERSRAPIPPIDPYLLEPLGGDLYAVVAEWELTPLERSVIAGRKL